MQVKARRRAVAQVAPPGLAPEVRPRREPAHECKASRKRKAEAQAHCQHNDLCLKWCGLRPVWLPTSPKCQCRTLILKDSVLLAILTHFKAWWLSLLFMARQPSPEAFVLVPGLSAEALHLAASPAGQPMHGRALPRRQPDGCCLKTQTGSVACVEGWA